MSSDSREQREKLKEEYKNHYRKMRAARERYKRVQKKKNIVDALKAMDSSELMESFDAFLFDIQSKVARAEARLDVAMESLGDSEQDAADQTEQDEALSQSRAKETLRQLKNEMGLLYNELSRKAQAMEVEKTIGSGRAADTKSDSSK